MKLSPAIVICDTMNLNGQMLLVFGTCQVFITDPAFISFIKHTRNYFTQISFERYWVKVLELNCNVEMILTIFFVTDLNLSSLQRESFSTSHRIFTPLFFILFPLRSSSLRCERFKHRDGVRMRHCFSVILHPHRLKTERERQWIRSMLSLCELNASWINIIQHTNTPAEAWQIYYRTINQSLARIWGY